MDHEGQPGAAFFLIIGAALGISYLFYDLYRARHMFEAPSVAIAQSAEEARSSVVQDVSFLDEYDGIYVFGLMKRMILDESARRRLFSSSLGNEEVAFPNLFCYGYDALFSLRGVNDGLTNGGVSQFKPPICQRITQITSRLSPRMTWWVRNG
jgi:hypothetical protein